MSKNINAMGYYWTKQKQREQEHMIRRVSQSLNVKSHRIYSKGEEDKLISRLVRNKTELNKILDGIERRSSSDNGKPKLSGQLPDGSTGAIRLRRWGIPVEIISAIRSDPNLSLRLAKIEIASTKG